MCSLGVALQGTAGPVALRPRKTAHRLFRLPLGAAPGARAGLLAASGPAGAAARVLLQVGAELREEHLRARGLRAHQERRARRRLDLLVGPALDTRGAVEHEQIPAGKRVLENRAPRQQLPAA